MNIYFLTPSANTNITKIEILNMIGYAQQLFAQRNLNVRLSTQIINTESIEVKEIIIGPFLLLDIKHFSGAFFDV